MKRVLLMMMALALLFSGVGQAMADMDVALGKPVTGSGYYNEGTETFPFANVTDGKYNDTGSPSNWSFWLTRNGTLDNFVVNLQGSYQLDSFVLQNTHNRDYNDRGTDGFTISVSTDGTNFTPVITGTLNSVSGTGNDIPFQTFNPSSPVTASYVEFQVTSYYGSGGGLNELQAYGVPSLPEPSGIALLGLGVVCLGVGYVVRKRIPGMAAA